MIEIFWGVLEFGLKPTYNMFMLVGVAVFFAQLTLIPFGVMSLNNWILFWLSIACIVIGFLEVELDEQMRARVDLLKQLFNKRQERN